MGSGFGGRGCCLATLATSLPAVTAPLPAALTPLWASDRDWETAARQIAEIMDQLPTRSVDQTGIAHRAGVDKALRIARTQENAAFSDDFMAEITTADELVLAAREMQAALKPQSPQTPTAEIERALAEFAEEGVLRSVSAREIQDFRSDLLNAARNAAQGDNPSRRRASLLGDLADARECCV